MIFQTKDLEKTSIFFKNKIKEEIELIIDSFILERISNEKILKYKKNNFFISTSPKKIKKRLKVEIGTIEDNQLKAIFLMIEKEYSVAVIRVRIKDIYIKKYPSIEFEIKSVSGTAFVTEKNREKLIHELGKVPKNTSLVNSSSCGLTCVVEEKDTFLVEKLGKIVKTIEELKS